MTSAGSHVIGVGLHTRLGRGLEAHADALFAATEDSVALPSAVQFQLKDEVVSAPYHLLWDAPLGAQDRVLNIVAGVVSDAIASSGIMPDQQRRAALFIGSSSSDIGLIEQAFKDDLAADPNAPPLRIRSSMANLEWMLRERMEFGPDGGSVNTACTAGASALIMADAGIREGLFEFAIVLGIEVFNVTTALGFCGLELLSRNGMRPFDDRRDGLVLGEGCAAIVLAKEAKTGGALRLRGGAANLDTHSISSPAPDACTVSRVISACIAACQVKPEEIRGVKAHATASLLNDEIESESLRQIFGPDGIPPLCVFKPYVGHTFGACALVELAMLAACLQRGFWPAAPGIASAPGNLPVKLPQQRMPIAPGIFLLNTFGFGGSNVCLAVSND